jgi:aspartyl-tRNA synthetase
MTGMGQSSGTGAIGEIDLRELEPLGDWRRSHVCGTLRTDAIGSQVTLLGWVHRLRDHGGVIFADLRDRTGVTQVVFRPEKVPAEVMARAEALRQEYVIGVRGEVVARPPGAENPEMPTGGIEIAVRELKLLNRALALPFAVDDAEDATVSEDLRLRYRFLELRTARLQNVLGLRHRMLAAVRRSLDAQGFLEIETPLLVKPTPEGARDYVVPSRLHPGKFFALPQSPQLYKQILMVAGCDRYYQIARCLRDEDLRADRQPEFSQIDLEMSFAGEEEVFAVIESMMFDAVKAATGVEIARPFPRLTYDEAMSRYGSDKPDLRLDLPMTDVTALARETTLPPFQEAAAAGGAVQCLRIPAPDWASRRIIEVELTETATRAGAKALGWTKVEAAGDGQANPNPFTGGVGKFLAPIADRLRAITRAEAGDLLLFVGDKKRRSAQAALGAVRLDVVRRLLAAGGPALGSLPPYVFHWVHRFPLFEQDETTGHWSPAHHMFTMPVTGDLERLESDPGAVRAELYDLVLNGIELGSGSIRVHRRDIQERIMKVIGMTPESIEERFGFLLGAFDFGAPPHGGIALGVDRLVMVLAGRSSLRETIAFPKTQKAGSLMDGAPAEVPTEELRELHIRLMDNDLRG